MATTKSEILIEETRKKPDTPKLEIRSMSQRAGSNLTPVRLERRGTLQSATGRFLGRLRRRKTPVHPSIPEASVDANPRPRGGPAQCTFDDVLASVMPTTSSSVEYPEFDALGPYLFSEKAAEKLWRDETTRLMDIALHPERPLEFHSQGYFQSDAEVAYRELSNLCKKILAAITICLLDNECINSQHCSQIASKQRLLELIDSVHLRQHAAESVVNSDAPEVQRRVFESIEATYSLIDYISAVITRMVVQTSPGPYWQKNMLAVLIKRITKLKVLLIDLQSNSAIAMNGGKAAYEATWSSDTPINNDLDEEEECEEFLRKMEANEKEGTASYEDKLTAYYCVEQNKFREGLNIAWKYVLTSMRFVNKSGMPATMFEICAVAHETGFEGFKSLLFQDRDLEYSATSELDNLNTAHAAFSIMNQTVMHLRKSKTAEDKLSGNLVTALEWAYSGDENHDYDPNIDLARRKMSLQLESMDKIITVMVLLTTVSPIFLSNFTSFRHIISLTGFIRDDAQPYAEGSFSAFFRMHTNQFDDDMERRDILRLSEALDQGFFSRSSLVLPSGHSKSYHLLHRSHPKTQQKALRELDDLTRSMDTWVIDENCVTVQCGWYVWTVVSIAATLAAGGLAVGFSVGSRIHGVDPSNIATYLWVVAAFILLVAKSMHVKDWSWNDFLLRRARCCSVSELQSITGVDAQLIIAKLLHDERENSVLNVRGPYNSVFLGRSTSGFSIDCPINPSTLLLSGLTMLKVVTAKGHSLVCLDSRRGTDLRVIGHNAEADQEYLCCNQIDRLQHRARGGKPASDNEHPVRLPFSRDKALKWKRVQGIYKLMNAEFV